MGKIACLGCSSSTLNRFSPSQIHAQQIVALSLSTVSIVLGVLSIYWLWKILRKFRHSLILLLIVSQLFKTFWSWIFLIVNMAQNNLLGINPTKGEAKSFCLATGTFVAFGNEGADYIVLMIAIHTVLTIMKPHALTKEAGLYPYRTYVYIGWVAFPLLLSLLAFINGTNAYILQGGMCALPIRPFWYRLALSWIPRYIILIFITVVAIVIYVHVHFRFKHVARNIGDMDDTLDSESPLESALRSQTHRAAPEAGESARRDCREASQGTSGTMSDASPPTLRERHRAIRKQLRYLFIYPVVYLLMWIVPFIAHCYGYTDRFVPFSLSTMSWASSCLQCAVECLVFLIREKPWRQKGIIPSTLHVSSWTRRIKTGPWGVLHRHSANPESRTTSTSGHTVGSDVQTETQQFSEKGAGMLRRPTLHWWDTESAAIDREAAPKGRVARLFSII